MDWINYEIYEVESRTLAGAGGVAGTARHGAPQVQRYLDELNNAYGGVGIGYRNDWRPGNRVGPVDFTAWNGFLQVHAELDLKHPGVIVYDTWLSKKAYEVIVEICAIAVWIAILKGANLPQGGLQPGGLQNQPAGVPPYWLPPGQPGPTPTPIHL